eukprot:10311643-Lingulodinium_polyedra.AAC.1
MATAALFGGIQGIVALAPASQELHALLLDSARWKLGCYGFCSRCPTLQHSQQARCVNCGRRVRSVNDWDDWPRR